MCDKAATSYFPLFVNIKGKRATVIGGGDTACRKVKMLLRFGAKVRVVAPEIAPGMEALVRGSSVMWLQSAFSPALLEGTDLLVAATNVRAVNHEAAEAAKEQRILIHVCDSRAESSFLFPVVVQNDAVIAGVVAADDGLSSTKSLVKRIREKFSALR